MTHRNSRFASINITREDRDEMRRFSRVVSADLDRHVSLSETLRHVLRVARWHREELYASLRGEYDSDDSKKAA